MGQTPSLRRSSGKCRTICRGRRGNARFQRSGRRPALLFPLLVWPAGQPCRVKSKTRASTCERQISAVYAALGGAGTERCQGQSAQCWDISLSFLRESGSPARWGRRRVGQGSVLSSLDPAPRNRRVGIAEIIFTGRALIGC